MKYLLCMLAFSVIFIPKVAVSPIHQVQAQTSDALDVWIQNLGNAECMNCPSNYKTIDTNGFYSYGKYQFQLSTFVQFYSKYYGKISEQEARIKINDYSLQEQLVRSMITDNPLNWKNWYNSVKTKLGLPPEI